MKEAQRKTNFSSNKKSMEILEHIYSFRCLTLEQLYKLIYDSWEVDIRLLNKLKRELANYLNKGVLISKEHTKGDVFFLTALGINLIRTYDTSVNVLAGGKATPNDHHIAFEMDVSPEFLNHQVNLNDFVVNSALDRGDVDMHYSNEKLIKNFHYTKPNGILSVLGNHFFLEMDMSTKGDDKLCEKADNYLRILGSPEFKSMDGKIIVLLIMQEADNTQERMEHVKNSFIKPLTDKVGERFEVYAGTRFDLYEVIHRIIRLSKHKN